MNQKQISTLIVKKKIRRNNAYKIKNPANLVAFPFKNNHAKKEQLRNRNSQKSRNGDG